MDCSRIITLLTGRTDYLSGQEISTALGVTRAAVWKEIDALRRAGWPIEASTRRGYRLSGSPPVLSAPYLNASLPAGSLFAGGIQVLSRVDSTNTQLKAMAARGAPEGTALLAMEQTAGRGTRGRSFQSPRGEGLYLSVLLRPTAALSRLFSLTGWAAVAVRQAVEDACGAPAQIKWLNDVYLHDRKLCGILTELSLLGESGEPDYVVIGVGVNLTQTPQRFHELGLGGIAASLAGEGHPVNCNQLALCLLLSLERMYQAFPARHQDYLEQYRRHCLTPGRAVTCQQDGRTVTGRALEVDGDFALTVQEADGRIHTISSGTVSLL